MAKIPLRKFNPNRKKIHYAKEDIVRAKVSNRKRRRKVRLVAFFVLLFFLFMASIFGLRWPEVQIVDIKIKGNSTVSAQEITAEIKPLIAGYYAFIIPKTSIFLYPRENIKQVLLDEFGYLATVDMQIKSFSVLEVLVSERTPKYVWCQNKEETNCFLADEEGFIFSAVNSKVDAGPLFKIIGTGKSELWKVYSYPIGKINFKQTKSFLDLIPKVVPTELGSRLQVQAVVLAPADDLIFKVTDKTNNSVYTWDLLISKRSELDSVVRHLEAVFSSSSFKKELTTGERLEYVDFRFGQKVFYKHKGSGQVIPEATEEVITEVDESED